MAQYGKRCNLPKVGEGYVTAKRTPSTNPKMGATKKFDSAFKKGAPNQLSFRLKPTAPENTTPANGLRQTPR